MSCLASAMASGEPKYVQATQRKDEEQKRERKRKCSCLECGDNRISHSLTFPIPPSTSTKDRLVEVKSAQVCTLQQSCLFNLPYRRIFLSSAPLDAWSTLILAPDSCSKPRIVSPPTSESNTHERLSPDILVLRYMYLCQ